MLMATSYITHCTSIQLWAAFHKDRVVMYLKVCLLVGRTDGGHGTLSAATSFAAPQGVHVVLRVAVLGRRGRG